MFESKERRIADRIKEYIKKKKPVADSYIMLRNGRIIDIDNYRDMVRRGKLNPKDAYVSIWIGLAPFSTSFRYPFLDWYESLLDAYLSKLGFYYDDHVVPATGLKYIALVERYENYLSIELANLDTVVNNTNLRKIVVQVLDGKLISGERELTNEEYDKIRVVFDRQKLFSGYDFYIARGILYNYYENGDASLVEEAVRIYMDYIDIFHPYRVCYEINSWKELDCSTIDLD